MSKIFGARMKMMYTNTDECRTRNLWYSADENEAMQKMEKAKAIAPPETCLVEFEPISDDVTLIEPGIYLTDKKKRVEIYTIGSLNAHGRFQKANGKPMVNETCVFYVNGDPITHTQWGKIVSKA